MLAEQFVIGVQGVCFEVLRQAVVEVHIGVQTQSGAPRLAGVPLLCLALILVVVLGTGRKILKQVMGQKRYLRVTSRGTPPELS